MELQIKNLSKKYPNGITALNNISLNIGSGMFGLLGQNGAGKSTLMRTIATLQDADSGSIFLDEINVLKQPHEMRKVLGYLPQEFGVYPNVTAEEMLLHIAEMKGMYNKKERKEAVEYFLHHVNLFDVRKKRLSSYSGGMKQRFGIAQALLGNPKIIIVDEPTAGLDPLERNRFYNFLSEIGENTIVILSTHIVEDVSTLCSNMAIMGNGEVLKTGKPDMFENELMGKLWEKQISKDEFNDYKESFIIISSRFHSGRLMITILNDYAPADDGWIPKAPSLEDTYFNVTANKKMIAVS